MSERAVLCVFLMWMLCAEAGAVGCTAVDEAAEIFMSLLKPGADESLITDLRAPRDPLPEVLGTLSDRRGALFHSGSRYFFIHRYTYFW